jgi:hypothetical protein
MLAEDPSTTERPMANVGVTKRERVGGGTTHADALSITHDRGKEKSQWPFATFARRLRKHKPA